jgi:hypothetical protein
MDAAAMPEDQIAHTIASWISLNSLETTSVYVSTCDRATRLAALVGEQVAHLGGRAWIQPVHSKGIAASERRTRLAAFQDGTFDRVLYKIVVSVRMLREGFDFKSLQSVVLVDVPESVADVQQAIARAMRADGVKTEARVLVFGNASSSELFGALKHAFDQKTNVVKFRMMHSTFSRQAEAMVEGSNAHKAATSAATEFHKRVADKLKRMSLEIFEVKGDERHAKTQAFCERYAERKPTRRGEPPLVYKLSTQTRRAKPNEIDAPYMWMQKVKGAWYAPCGGRPKSPDWQKTMLRALPWWTDPDEDTSSRKPFASRVDEAIAFFETHGRPPVTGKKDGGSDEEVSLGLWISRHKSERAKIVEAVGEDRAATFYVSIEKRECNLDGLKRVLTFCVRHKDRASQPWPKRDEKPEGSDLDTIRQGIVRDREAARALVEETLQGDAFASTRAYLLASIDNTPHETRTEKKRLSNAKRRGNDAAEPDATKRPRYDAASE